MSDKFFNETLIHDLLGDFFKPQSSFMNWRQKDPVGVVEINCAGRSRDDLSLEVEDDYLVLSGTMGQSINIPTTGYDLDTVEAVYSNGLLTLTIQKLKPTSSQSRKIINK